MKLAPPALVALAVLAGCGSSGDGDSPASTAQTTGGQNGSRRPVFRSAALGFTFEYPREFRAEQEAQNARPGIPAVLVQVAVARPARFNAVKVRQSADREFKPSRYVREFKRAFAADAEGDVKVGPARFGDLPTTLIEFDDAGPGDPPVQFRSSSYFFTGAGRTWQVECISQEEHREDVDRACRTVLESVEFRRRLARGGDRRDPDG